MGEQIRAREMKELQRLREMERRKKAIEEEIAKEKQHLIDLQLLELDSLERSKNVKPKAAIQYETMVAKRTQSSPLPPPPSPRKHFLRPTMKPPKDINKGSQDAMNIARMTEAQAREQMHHELKSLHELKILEEQKRMEIEELKRQSEEEQSLRHSPMPLNQTKKDMDHTVERELSLEDTIKDLESTTNQLREFAEKHCPEREGIENVIEDPKSIIEPNDSKPQISKSTENEQPEGATADEIKDAAGAVREVAHALLKALTPTPEQSDDQYQVPEGIVKNVKNALQKLDEIPPSPNFQNRMARSGSSGRKSVEIEEELKEIQHTGKVKSTASLFKSSSVSDNQAPLTKNFPPPEESPKPSRRIGNLFRVEHKKWNQPIQNNQQSEHKYDDEEDTEGYSEGNEEFSCGIELPTQDDKAQETLLQYQPQVN